MMRKFAALIATVLAIACAGCGTTAIDYPLLGQQHNQDRRTVAAVPDHPLVVLAFSGGGSRAASLAAAITERLDQVSYSTSTGPRKLSQDIAIVSSVSGGSLYATYLALHGPSFQQAEIFKSKIAAFDGIGYIEAKAADPLTWINLQLENTTRIDLLQQMFSSFLMTDAKLSLLNQPNEPLFLLNASDMVAGEVFTFDPATIDDVCMNYDQMPLTLATTASAAYPIAFTPVLLRNQSYVDTTGCPARQIPPSDWRNQLREPAGRYIDLEAFRLARYRDSLRGARYVDSQPGDPDSFRHPEYLRLVDGGVIDNLGLTAIRRALTAPGSPANLTPLIAQGRLKQLVIIMVNARSDPVSPLDSTNKYTTVLDSASAISGALVDSASAGSASTFRGFMENLLADRSRLLKTGSGEFEVYPIDIDFDQLPNSTPDERARLNSVKSIATSWTLKPGDVPLIDSVAGELLWSHPCFTKLLADLQAQATPDPNSHPVPGLRCPWPTVEESK